MDWAARQARILSGGGVVERCWPDFPVSELPHGHLAAGTSGVAYRRWRAAGLRTPELAGCWERPLFTGAFEESGAFDTFVRNVQTPSLFVDLRFPLMRAHYLGARPNGLRGASDEQLSVLARQHCFAGYSKPYEERAGQPVIARHHCVDWNYHPSFPRSRPNMWRVEMSATKHSFKEWAYATDAHGQSIYMERWQRVDEPGQSGAYMGAVSSGGPREGSAVLCVVGRHVGYARGRLGGPVADLGEAGGGGCAQLVDFCVSRGRRNDAEALLDVEGSYAVVCAGGSCAVQRSTHPWREGAELFCGATGRLRGRMETLEVDGRTFDILENSLAPEQVARVLGVPRSRL